MTSAQTQWGLGLRQTAGARNMSVSRPWRSGRPMNQRASAFLANAKHYSSPLEKLRKVWWILSNNPSLHCHLHILVLHFISEALIIIVVVMGRGSGSWVLYFDFGLFTHCWWAFGSICVLWIFVGVGSGWKANSRSRLGTYFYALSSTLRSMGSRLGADSDIRPLWWQHIKFNISRRLYRWKTKTVNCYFENSPVAWESTSIRLSDDTHTGMWLMERLLPE